MSYAQISAPEKCTWADVIALVERVGPMLREHAARGEIGRPILDIAFVIGRYRMSASLLVPNEVVAAIDSFGFDLEASACLSEDA